MPHRLREPALWRTLRWRFGVGVLLLFSAVFALVAYNTQRVLEDVARASSSVNARQVAQTLNLALSPHTATPDDLRHVQPYLQELISPESEGLTYLLLYDEQGRELARTDAVPAPLPPVDVDLAQAWPRGQLHLQQEILLGDQQVGRLRYGLSSQLLRDAARQLAQRNALLYAGVLVLLASGLVWVLSRLGRRLQALAEAGAQLARGAYDHAAPTDGDDELALLGHELNAMAEAVRSRIHALEDSQASVRRLNEELEGRVERRTAELREANQALEQSLTDLRRLQDGLVQSEKLASLGALVAAVAHELNTPIGNALSVATAFEQKAADFGQQARTRLQRQALEQHLADSAEACLLLHRNLAKASELITSFKHVAIDQTSSQRRPFDLAQTLGDVLATLAPGLRQRPRLRVETDLASGIRMLSYPGPLGQVLTNLCTNAVLHAYPPERPEQPGVLRLRSWLVDAQTVGLAFEDDGVGMDAATLRHIFDPFFTTRLGQGGSGLGMHIVHNLVLGLLHGRIEIDSHPGAGTRVQLWLPLEAPLATVGIDDNALAAPSAATAVSLRQPAP